MLPKWHILSGAVFSLVLFLFGVSLFNSIIVFLSSFLIDVDHYLFYVFKKKDFSLRRANKWFLDSGKRFDNLPKLQRKKHHLGYFPLHSIEVLLPLFLLGLLNSFLFFVFIGFGFHVLFDMIYEIFVSQRAIYKISIVYTLLSKKDFSPQ